MEKQYGPSASEKKIAMQNKGSATPMNMEAHKPVQQETKSVEAKKEETKTDNKVETTAEVKTEAKTEVKEEKKKIPKKTEAIVDARDLGISKKHSMAICDMIRGRNPDMMIKELEKVLKYKRAVRMKGEIPHRHGNIMSGRYPINASKVFINLLKGLSANANVNGMENPIIFTAVPNDASRPAKRGGRERFKRTNVLLIAKEKVQKNQGKNDKMEVKIK